MFLKALVLGFGMYAHWETYAVSLIYIVVCFIPLIPLFISSEKADALVERTGCLFLILQSLFQSLAVFISISILFPLLIGRSSAGWTIPWMFLYQTPLQTLLLVLAMVVIGAVSGLLPILGNSKTFGMFVMGSIVIGFLVMILAKANPNSQFANMDPFPGWLFVIGITAISAIFTWLATIIVALAISKIGKDSDDVGYIVGLIIGPIFGFLPVFIYGAWIRLQIA